jgi:hypothetical protein
MSFQNNVHNATFDYNYVFRALWGEKWCTTPLQDLDPLVGKKLESMIYRTVKPTDNNHGYIINVAQDMASILPYVHHHDPKFLEDVGVKYVQHHKDTPGCISPRGMFFTKTDLWPVNLIDGSINTSPGGDHWSYVMRFESNWEFFRFMDIVHEIRRRWQAIMAERESEKLAKSWNDCNRIFRVNESKLLTSERIHTLTVYRELINAIIDCKIGESARTIEALGEETRYECFGDDAQPIRALYFTVRREFDDKEAEIL